MNRAILGLVVGFSLVAAYLLGVNNGEAEQRQTYQTAYAAGERHQSIVDDKAWVDRQITMRRMGVCTWAHLMANCPLPKEKH